MPAGRPKKSAKQLAADQKVKNAIVDGISEGKTMTSLCREKSIGVRTIHNWQDNDGEFAASIAHARQLGFDAIADHAMEIADDKESDPDAASRRIRADVRLKLLAKWDPRRYGDAVQLKHADADGDKLDIGPVSVAIRAAALIHQALDRDSDAGES